MENPLEEGVEMTAGDKVAGVGLQHRLEHVPGVSEIELELDAGGLSGIRVNLKEGASETEVLERIRSILVTYGVHSQALRTGGQEPEISYEVWTNIAPAGEGLIVELGKGERRVSREIPADPLAAAQAVVDARCELEGLRAAKVIWMGLDRVGYWRVLTVLVRGQAPAPSVGAAVVTEGWADALGRAVEQSLRH
jgi:hypothetical protein